MKQSEYLKAILQSEYLKAILQLNSFYGFIVQLDITENDDFFSHVDAMFTTPGVKGRGSWPLSEKTPIPKFVSPGILKDPNRYQCFHVHMYLDRTLPPMYH